LGKVLTASNAATWSSLSDAPGEGGAAVRFKRPEVILGHAALPGIANELKRSGILDDTSAHAVRINQRLLFEAFFRVDNRTSGNCLKADIPERRTDVAE
jgi:hypothetical protein